jgi:hypothetical protein
VLRNRRLLFVLVPALLGLAYYNVSFFRERSRRMQDGAAPAQTAAAPGAPAAPASSTASLPAAAPSTAPRPLPRSYAEALTWMAPRPTHPELALASSWSARDIFRQNAAASALAVMAGPSPPAAAAAGAKSATTAPGVPEPPRVDGLVKTPHGTYAIVNGRFTKVGTALSSDERVVRIGRSGVVLSTMGGAKVLPLAGEVTPPHGSGSWERKP